MLAHSDETDDSHAPSQSHPGCAVVPAALAAGEQFGIDGTHFLRAVALGYDIGPRVTHQPRRPSPFATTRHQSTHSIAGDFGAAAAAGCAAGLNAQQMRWLLDYAAQQSSGIAAWQRDTEHIEKAFVFGGMPARNGVTAALLVQAGLAPASTTSSRARTTSSWRSRPRPIPTLLDRASSASATRSRAPTSRSGRVGSPIQAPLDALARSCASGGRSTPTRCSRSIVRAGATARPRSSNNREMPDICLQHMVAVMLLDKTASFKAAHDKSPHAGSGGAARSARRSARPDEELERSEPARQAIVEVTLTDGTALSERVEAVRGTADNPMTRDEVVAKCRDLMAPVLGKAKATELIETVLGIEKVKDIRELRGVLQKA